jgi:hypothetical protein
MSLARRHRDHHAALAAAGAATRVAAADMPAVIDPARSTPATIIALRLTEDLRRLHEIRSIERKIELKRELLPAYAAWVQGLLDAAAESGAGAADDVLPTIMVWRIDTGDHAGAIPLAEYVLAYDVPLPSRYNRNAPTLIVEMFAEAALKELTADRPFDLDMLRHVEAITEDCDIHDQVRAKLHKAIGLELMRRAIAADPDASPAGFHRAAFGEAITALGRARDLHPMIGVKQNIDKAERALKGLAPVDAPSA